MKPKTKALTAAITGNALGIAGLAVLAMPADAGERPTLPAISAEELVESALTNEWPDFAGTVAVDNQLGLPDIPGANLTGLKDARVWHEGDKARLSVRKGSAEQTIVNDGQTAWVYDSEKNTVTKHQAPEHDAPKHGPPADPTVIATQAIAKLKETSTVTVDGTARVADRPAYELVLTPKPSERTLLREVRVAIDSETRMPMRFEVLPNGSQEPVLSAGFTEFTTGDQDDALFEFTTPKGAEVVAGDEAAEQHKEAAKRGAEAAEKVREDVKIVGDGWDTVVTGELPAEALSGEVTEGGRDLDPQALLEQVGKRVSGEWGSGYVITTRAGTALLTDDGRFAAGAVPQQVLIEALDDK